MKILKVLSMCLCVCMIMAVSITAKPVGSIEVEMDKKYAVHKGELLEISEDAEGNSAIQEIKLPRRIKLNANKKYVVNSEGDILEIKQSKTNNRKSNQSRKAKKRGVRSRKGKVDVVKGIPAIMKLYQRLEENINSVKGSDYMSSVVLQRLVSETEKMSKIFDPHSAEKNRKIITENMKKIKQKINEFKSMHSDNLNYGVITCLKNEFTWIDKFTKPYFAGYKKHAAENENEKRYALPEPGEDWKEWILKVNPKLRKPNRASDESWDKKLKKMYESEIKKRKKWNDKMDEKLKKALDSASDQKRRR